MKDEHKKIKKQSYVSFFLSYCIYFYNIWLIHLLINEITQLGIITVYRCSLSNFGRMKKKVLPGQTHSLALGS